MQIQVCGRERVLKNLAPCLVICILEGHMACVSDAGRSQLIINMDYLKKKKVNWGKKPTGGRYDYRSPMGGCHPHPLPLGAAERLT